MYTIPNHIIEKLLSFLAGEKEYVFLDSSKPSSENPCSYLFIRPEVTLQLCEGDDPTNFFLTIESWLGKGFYVAGWMNYELGYIFEKNLFEGRFLNKEPGKKVLARFNVYNSPLSFDHRSGEHNLPQMDSLKRKYSLRNVRPDMERRDYLERIAQIKELIVAGDTYQVNFTLRLLFDLEGSPEAFYQQLRMNQTVSHGALIRTGEEFILSLSPEMFFKIGTDGITMKPMKGTIRKGNRLCDVEKNTNYLCNDVKNCSENVMIVDLLRNDLGRLVHELSGGEVSVKSLFDVEDYETLLQMTSTINGSAVGNMLSSASVEHVFRALFPCGSITGAPKIRTMQIIEQLEGSARGVYTGAIGYFGPDGRSEFSVPIRTVVVKGNRGEMGIGSGIVYDSNPENEWEECLLKAEFLTGGAVSFQLLETMLWNKDTGCRLLNYHMRRLKQSASFFHFEVDDKAVRSCLEKAVEAYGGERAGEHFRVRLTLAKDGHIDVTVTPYGKPAMITLPEYILEISSDMPVVSIHSAPVDTDKPHFYHKTTNRKFYDEIHAKGAADGLLDVLLINTDGEVTEGCISNVIIYKEGRYYTPALSCGLLGGVMRSFLFDCQSPGLEEKVITRDDLENADALFICNAVRGVVQVTLD